MVNDYKKTNANANANPRTPKKYIHSNNKNNKTRIYKAQ